MEMQNGTLYQEFLVESFENLNKVNQELSQLEKDPHNSDIINSIYRTVHTLKGSAGFLGFNQLQQLAHSIENVLDLIRNKTLPFHSSLMDTLLESFDLCGQFLKNIEKNQTEGDLFILEIIHQLQQVTQNRPEKKCETDVGQYLHKDLLSENISSQVEIKNPPINKNEVTMETKSPQVEQKIVEKEKDITDTTIRVQVKLLDQLMNEVGELVLNRNQFLQYMGQNQSTKLNRLVQQLNLITSELQNDIMITRMQPIGTVTSKFDRIVRDLARKQGKKIGLELIGQETELDKTLLEAIKDPLTHLIRNSVDHGIESPEMRKAANKDSEGLITLKAYHKGGQVYIEIKDNGQGIDPEKVLKKAIEKDLITHEEAKKMSEKEVYGLIFKPGFSTAEKVTDISGRGVGMDVVKTNIEKIGGVVDISSVKGEGCSVKLKIPLTLAVVPALLIECGQEYFAIPQINLVELVRLEAENGRSFIEKIHDTEFFRLRDKAIPVFRLHELLGLEKIVDRRKHFRKLVPNSEDLSVDQQIQFVDESSISIVILSAEERIFGLIVDQILDTEEIVIKPLGQVLKNLKHFAGATIIGSGRMALILEPQGLLNYRGISLWQKDLKLIDKELSASEEGKPSRDEGQDYILFALEDKHIYAIPLTLVGRLEEFKQNQIEYSVEMPLIHYNDHAMPLINLEQSLHIKNPSLLEKEISNPPLTIPTLVLKTKGRNFGIVVSKIMDIVRSYDDIDYKTSDRKEILGTVYINKKTVTIVDIFAVLEKQSFLKNIIEESTEKLVGESKRILLAEDSPLFQKIESETIKEHGFYVDIAVDGEKGLDLFLKNEPYDLIVTDIEMPNMNGYEFTEQVRKHPKGTTIPIIAVTSKVNPEDLERGKVAGFTAHLEKFNREELINGIYRHLKLVRK